MHYGMLHHGMLQDAPDLPWPWMWYLTPKFRNHLTYLLADTTMVLYWAHIIGIIYFGMDVGV